MATEYDVDDFLAHHGVKGMKWGVRNDNGHVGEQAKTKVIAKADKKYEKSFSGMAGFAKMHNEMAGQMNARLDGLNKKFEGVDVRVPGTKGHTDYHKAYEGIIAESAKAAMNTFGMNASGTGRVKITKVGKGEDAWWQAEWQELKHADSGLPMKIKPKYDSKGFILSQTIEPVADELKHVDDVEEFLAHFGVKGMHWGVRRGDYEGATRKVNREASKDAAEFARAKMFYGDGAGTRRKLIKAKVEAKSKQNPSYKAAFDHHVGNQDLNKHADKATSERRRKDAKASVGKTARGVNRAINGPFAPAVGAAVLAGAYGVAKSKHYDAYLIQAGKNFAQRYF